MATRQNLNARWGCFNYVGWHSSSKASRRFRSSLKSLGQGIIIFPRLSIVLEMLNCTNDGISLMVPWLIWLNFERFSV